MYGYWDLVNDDKSADRQKLKKYNKNKKKSLTVLADEI